MNKNIHRMTITNDNSSLMENNLQMCFTALEE